MSVLRMCRYPWKVTLDTGNNDCLCRHCRMTGEGGFLLTLYPSYISNSVPWSCTTYERKIKFKRTLKSKNRGAWVAQSFKRPTLAQVMISWFMGSSPMSGSVLTVQSLETASASVSPSFSARPLPCLSLSLSFKNK